MLDRKHDCFRGAVQLFSLGINAAHIGCGDISRSACFRGILMGSDQDENPEGRRFYINNGHLHVGAISRIRGERI